MTLRGVIQGLLRGSDDAEAMLADEGYGDLPAEIFGQALSSYADTAPMDEADALSPVLTTLDSGDSSDVFAVLQEQPLTVESGGGSDLAGLGALGLGASVIDDTVDDDAIRDEADLDDFGTAAPLDEESVSEEAVAEELDETSGHDAEELSLDADDPFAGDDVFGDDLFGDDGATDSAAEFEEQEEFFDTEPTATGEDPSDLDF